MEGLTNMFCSLGVFDEMTILLYINVQVVVLDFCFLVILPYFLA